MKKLLWMLICLTGLAASSQAVLYSITSNTNDTFIGCGVDGLPTNNVANATLTQIFLADDSAVNGRSNNVGIVMFQLPALTAELITNASLRVYWMTGYPGGSDPFPKNCEIYGIRYGTNSAARTSDYAFKSVGVKGTLIQSNLFVLTNSVVMMQGTNVTDTVGSANLATWLNAQYTAGAKGGDFVFLRIATDKNTANPVYIASANSIAATNPPPLMTITTLDISKGPCELVFTNTTPAKFIQKPFVTTNLPFAVYNAGYNATNVVVSLAANYPWLTINGATSTNISSISGAKPVGPAATVTNLFNVTIASNAPVGTYANAFTLTMSGTGLDLTNKTFSSPVSLEIVNTAFSSISKTSLAAPTNGTDYTTLTISNTAAFALAFNLTHSPSAAWLTYPSGTLTLPANSSTNITVTASGGLSAGEGQYSSVLSVNYLNNTSTPNPTNFPLIFDVGPKIEPLTGLVTITSAGGINLLTNRFEPGEDVTITIISTNNGSVTVNSITNTLTGPSGFGVSPAFTVYPSMVVGSKTSTTYQVTIPLGTLDGSYTFTAKNSADGRSWSRTFTMDVYNQAVPSVSTNLTITVPVNGSATGTITLTNAGNKSTTFALTDNGAWAVTYMVSTQTMSMVSFPGIYDAPDTNNTFVSWVTNRTAPMKIGFNFPFYGTVYTNFSVSRYGTIEFGEAAGGNSYTPPALPFGNVPLAAAFWGNTTVSTNSVRYMKQADKLVVAWGNRTGKEFQAWIYTNGQIRYLYQQATWNGGVIGVQNSSNLYQTVNYTPGNGSESVLLTPNRQSWVTSSATNGTLGALSSQVITYTANAAGQAVGTNTFNVTVTWGDGSTHVVAVKVIIASSNPNLSAPASVSFSGPAGDVTKTTMAITNTGDIPINFTITDTGTQTAGYVWTNTTFSWDDSHWDSASVDNVVLLAGDDKTAWFPIGFEFPFYGNIYTQFLIDVNAGVVLSSNPLVVLAPFSGVSLMANSNLRYSGNANQLVVTWEDVRLSDNDQTFQAILAKNGTIRFQYKSLIGSNAWSSADNLIRDTTNRITRASLSNSTTTVTTTNIIMTVTNWVYDTPQYLITTNITVSNNALIANQAILFTPINPVVISVDPVSGNLPVGGKQTIKIIGDARSLTFGGTNKVSVSTIFDVYHPGLVPGTNITTNVVGGVTNIVTNMVIATVSKPVSVLFRATNSADSAFSALDSDADGMSDRTEALAGTDEYNADSVFGMSVVQNTDGSRTLLWPRANDTLSRTYTVWYTTDLMSDWIALYSNDNFTSYTDREHATIPVIYYRVTVK